MPTRQEAAVLDQIYNVAVNSLGNGQVSKDTLELIVAICRHQNAMIYTNDEIERFNPYGN